MGLVAMLAAGMTPGSMQLPKKSLLAFWKWFVVGLVMGKVVAQAADLMTEWR